MPHTLTAAELTAIEKMPKVELHVHMEGSIRPATLLKLAQKNNKPLPYDTVEGLQRWYTFTDFPHFVEIYIAITQRIVTPDDIELITREFLQGQAEQNILYTEATYTPYTVFSVSGIPFDEQLDALNRARAWGRETLGVGLNFIFDINREVTPEQGRITAEWAISAHGRGCVALGLGGYEVGNPPEKFVDSFRLAAEAGLPSVPHAGETTGPASIRGALDALGAVRIGHGVRCLEDPTLVETLRERQIPLEVCPTSNICLKVFPTMADHVLPRLLQEGLYVTINSDDPPMFNTTLTREYQMAAQAFGWDVKQLQSFVRRAAHAALLPPADKAALLSRLEREFAALNAG